MRAEYFGIGFLYVGAKSFSDHTPLWMALLFCAAGALCLWAPWRKG